MAVGELPKDEEWNELVARVKERFNLTGDGLQNARAFSNAFNIRAGQSTAKGSCAGIEFRPQDVEPLLEQASIILDRAAVDLATAQTLGEKLANLSCDLMQFFAVDNILIREEVDGKFKVDEIAGKSQYDANEARVVALKGSVANRESLAQRNDSQQSPGKEAKERAAALAYLRAQYNPQQAPAAPNAPSGSGAGQKPYFAVPAGADNSKNKIDIDLEFTEAQSEYGQKNDHCAALAALADGKAQLSAAELSKAGLAAQMDWAKRNTDYLAERAKAIRDVMRYKAALADFDIPPAPNRHSGDLLDFASRMKAIKKRYQGQLADAYLRLEAVEMGLQSIYNYKDALPKPLSDSVDIFEDILAWTRRAAAWLAALTRRSHNYVLPISVKRSCGGDAKWQEGKRKGEWHFKIDESLFSDNERLVRIRGICAWCSGKDGPYVLDVTLPKNQFDQKPERCRLGRVLSRRGMSMPEVSGVTALFNASPIGEWKVKPSDPVHDRMNWPDDFQIDLYLSVLIV